MRLLGSRREPSEAVALHKGDRVQVYAEPKGLGKPRAGMGVEASRSVTDSSSFPWSVQAEMKGVSSCPLTVSSSREDGLYGPSEHVTL